VVSVTDPHGSNLCFFRQEPLLFYQVAPQLYSRGFSEYILIYTEVNLHSGNFFSVYSCVLYMVFVVALSELLQAN
jgi:hypothetical protein